MFVQSANDSQVNIEFLHTSIAIGAGSFGTVYLNQVRTSDGKKLNVAIKKVSSTNGIDEMEMMRKVGDHQNIVKFYFYYNSTDKSKTGDRLVRCFNFVLELMPYSLHQYIKRLLLQESRFEETQFKLFAYQLFRALGFCHANKICHRDVKPHNILVCSETNRLKLCDFGCAKELNDPNIINSSYVCSRYYRAPELTLGATHYGTKIDIWSAGCVVAEMATLSVLFPGDSNIDMINKIVRVLGSPTTQEMSSMKPNYKNKVYISEMSKRKWPRKLVNCTDVPLRALIECTLQYNPRFRLSGYDACAHYYFDELRMSDKETRQKYPPLFNFSDKECSAIDKLEMKLKPREIN